VQSKMPLTAPFCSRRGVISTFLPTVVALIMSLRSPLPTLWTPRGSPECIPCPLCVNCSPFPASTRWLIDAGVELEF
jgi:hypothetical protein